MLLKFKYISSVFCDFSSLFPGIPAKFLEEFDIKWSDNFEELKNLGNSRFQFIQDYKSGMCLFNHEGTLYPFSERKILERRYKIKEPFLKERLGDRTPFRIDNVYFCETGFNSGDVEFMMFDINKQKFNSFESYRTILYRFPFYWFLDKVVTLAEINKRRNLASENLQKNESDQILKQKEMQGWKLMERDVSPSMDPYREIVELPLHNYYFCSSDVQVNIWMKIEFF